MNLENKTKDNQTVVDDHRNMLMVSKKVSSFQEQNLKSWAFLFFKDLETVEVSWNFLKGNKANDFFSGKIDYNLKFKKGSEVSNEKAEEGMQMLDACVKFLFWSETKVNIKKNGKKWTIKK